MAIENRLFLCIWNPHKHSYANWNYEAREGHFFPNSHSLRQQNLQPLTPADQSQIDA